MSGISDARVSGATVRVVQLDCVLELPREMAKPDIGADVFRDLEKTVSPWRALPPVVSITPR